MHKIVDASVSMPIFSYPADQPLMVRNPEPVFNAFQDYPKQKVSIFQE
jgi:hypothetical protein